MHHESVSSAKTVRAHDGFCATMNGRIYQTLTVFGAMMKNRTAWSLPLALLLCVSLCVPSLGAIRTARADEVDGNDAPAPVEAVHEESNEPSDEMPDIIEDPTEEPATGDLEREPEEEPSVVPEAELLRGAEDSDAGEISWDVTIAPERNTTMASITVDGLDAILASGEADGIVIDASIVYKGTVTRSVTETRALADIDTDSNSFEMDFENYGKFSVTVRFTNGGSTVSGSTSSQAVGIVADEYIIAPLTATMPVTMFSLSLWGEGNIRTSGPTIAMLMRAGAWDWAALPGPRDGMYGVYALPYITLDEIAIQGSDYSEESALFNAHLAAFCDYVRDLYELNPSSTFHLYTGDNFPNVIQQILYANGIPEGQYTIALLSDGTGSYSHFANAYNAADNTSLHNQLVGEWTTARSYAYENRSVKSGFGGYIPQYCWAAIDAESEASWWLIRPALLETAADGNSFATSVRGDSQVRSFNIANTLSNIQASGDESVAEFKALFNFNDGYFSAAQESGKDAMVFLGSRVTSEPGFEDYARFVMTYYGDDYVYYYKGHPATPTDLNPAKAAQLDALGIIDVDSTIAAELILFFNPEIYLSGYASSTYASVPEGMAKGMFNMTKAAGLDNVNYRNMEFWATAVSDSTPAAAKALCTEGHANYLIEFSDDVIAREGYDIAIWDASDSVVIYYKLLDDGTYQEIGSDQGDQTGAKLPEGTYVIQSALKPGQVLDVNGQSANPGANVALWAYGGRTNQQWNLSYDESGFAIFTNINSGLALDVNGESSKNGTNVSQWTPNGRPSQQWRIRVNTDGTYTLVSAVNNRSVLDTVGYKSANGTNIDLWEDNGGKNQRFLLIPVPPQVSPDGMAKLTDGLYSFTPAVNTAERLDISGESVQSGGNAIVWTSSSMDNQVFSISKAEDGFFVIENVNSGLVLDIPSGSLIAGANVCQSERDEAQLTQEWAIYQRSGGSYVFKNVGTGLVLEVADGSKTAGANVQGGAEDGSQAQRWSVTRTTTARASLDALARQYKNCIVEGDYVIQTVMADGQIVAIKGSSTAVRANAELDKYTSRASQRWNIAYDDQGYAIITNKGSGLVLEVAGGSHQSGANVRQAASDGSYGQKWIIQPNGDGSFTFISGVSPKIVLDVTGCRTASGTNIETYTANGTKAQSFFLFALEPVIPKVGMANDLDGGVFVVAPVIGPERALDVSGCSTKAGGNIICWTSNGGANQQWRFIRLDDGFYRIESVLSGLPLDVSGNNVIPGSNVIQWTANGGLNQEWAVYRSGDGTYTIRNVGTGLMLDLYGSSTKNGANVDAYRANGARSQQWTLAEVGE